MKLLYTLLFLVAVSSVTAAARELRPPPKALHHCPINQVYKACKGCDLRCEDMGAFRICPKICVPGCACADGYVKNPDGKCVRQEDCPYPYKPFQELNLEATCSPNEEFRICKGCDQTCENLGKPVFCTYDCISGCACKEGYVRHDGKCIQQLQCPISGPIPILPDDFVLPPNDTPYIPEDIPLDTFSPPIDLMPETCPINEVFSQCKACDQGCPGIDPPVACTKDCRPGCSCKEGYVRSHGKCINKLQCPQIEPVELVHEPQIIDDCDDTAPPSCPANQHFAECLPCNEACPGFGSDICPLICKSGCACDPGFSRMENGRCIPTIQCPQIDPMPQPPTDDTCEATIDILPPERAQTKCPINEEFTECGSCEPTCQSLRKPTGCLAVCIVGCQCKAGFVRENGVCIPAYQCPLDYPRGPYLDQVDPPVIEDTSCLDQVAPSCPVNEHFDECLPCNEQCPGFGSDICLLMCQSGCACDKGFSRFGGRCIPTNQCPQIDPMPRFYDAIPTPPGIPDILPVSVKRPDPSTNDPITFHPIPTQPVDQCPKNEVYSTCGGCEETCESLFQPMMCAAVCVVGCQCKPGYLREKGQCVDASFCPARSPSTTAPTLDTIKEESVTLDTIKKESVTLDVIQVTPEANQCPINEVFKECKSCDQTCGSLSDPLMCTMECVPGCSCLEGYVRDNGVCVPVSQCFEDLDVKPVDEKPAPEEPKHTQIEQQCPVNEEFKRCKGCDHTCWTLNHPLMCSMICMPGCACKSGFVRKDGVCVEPSECPVENTSSRYFDIFNEIPVFSVEMNMEPFISMFAEPQSSAHSIP